MGKRQNTMKNFNWLVKLLFYKHKEKEANLTKDTTGVFFTVGYVDQVHANLCTNASESMINHFWDKPFATMAKNPRGVLEGASPNDNDYQCVSISPNEIQANLKNSGPFILSLPLRYEASHSVVVTGCTADQIIYNDPLTGSHKMISIDELNGLAEHVEIAINRSVSEGSVSKRIKTTLPEHPPDIIPKNYKEFFSLDKMDDPCAAVLNFLEDYAKFSLWSPACHHRKEVSDLVERNKGRELNELLSDLDKTFPKDALNSKGELLKRLLTIEKMINNPTQELEVENYHNHSP
jgi:hypothetical protein